MNRVLLPHKAMLQTFPKVRVHDKIFHMVSVLSSPIRKVEFLRGGHCSNKMKIETKCSVHQTCLA